jgi:hypothetical protein
MTDVITYNTELEQLLKENSEECESLSILHRMSYEKYNKRSNYINIPVIILSSAIGFITGIDLQYDKMNIILGVGSVFVGIIKSVDTYFQLAKRAESHRICSLQFSQISKKLQIELTLHRRQRATAENMMNIVKTDIKNMQDIAPLIDDDIIEIYNGKYRRYKRVKKPNFVNGLTEVKVNPYNNEREYEYASRQGSREASPNNGNRIGDDNDGDDDHNGGDNGGVGNNTTDIIRQASPPHSQPPPQSAQDSNKSIEPMVMTMAVDPNILAVRSSPSLAAPSPIQDTAVLLQMLQQLQAQAQAQAQAHTPSPAPAAAAAAAAASAPISPSTSVRSDTSIHLGEIRTDSNGVHIVNM